MPLQTYKTRDEVPEDAREGVLELKDGTFAVVVDDAKDTILKIRQERDAFKKQAREAADRAEQAERERDAAKASSGDVDKKVADLLTKWEKDTEAKVAAVAKERDDALGQLRQVTLVDKARDTFVKAGGRPEKAEAALKLVRDRLDLIDGKPVVKDEKGEVTTTTLDDLFGKEFRKEMPEFFAGTKASGSGAQGTQKVGGANGASLDVDALLKDPGMAFRLAAEAA
jgi:hypothetical protein